MIPDADAQFEAFSAAFFSDLAGGATVADALKTIPDALPCWKEVPLDQCVEDLRVSLAAVKLEGSGALEEVDVFVPLYRTMPLRLAVVFDALAKCLSLPMVMLWDSFKVVLSSLLHKDVGVKWQQYSIRHRYWAVVTSDPGAGKSHALQFIMGCLLSAMEDPSDAAHFPGCPEDNFHVVHDGTHAAFAARLNRTGGCALLASPEGTAVLCPKFPGCGEFSKSSHIDLEKCLEAAGGGAIHWDTQESVLNKAKNARRTEQLQDKGVHWEQTNFAFIFFQQVAMLQCWWAQAEAKWKKGLTNRFLFSTGRRPLETPCPTGMVETLRRYLVDIMKLVAQTLGQSRSQNFIWKPVPEVEKAFREVRASATELSQEAVYADGGSFHSMLEKTPYWLAHEALMNEVLTRASAIICCNADIRTLQEAGQISSTNGKLSMHFIFLRLARSSAQFLEVQHPVVAPEHKRTDSETVRDSTTWRSNVC